MSPVEDGNCTLVNGRREWGRILAPLCLAAALAPPAQAGEIRGRVQVAGPRPVEEYQPVLKHREFCGERMPSERIRVGADGGVADVLVTLEGPSIQQRTGYPAGRLGASRTAVLDNLGCRFVPRVQVLSPGSRLEVRNSDPILHTVHAYLGMETLFHLALPVFRQRAWVSLDRPGLVRVDCDVGHTWMRAYILVRAHAFAAVTGPDGGFHFRGVPAGAARLRVWHEALGVREESVRVAEGRITSTTLVYNAPAD